MDVKKSGFGESFKARLSQRVATYQKTDAIADLTAGLFSFLFAGAHGLFGAFPFGIALLAVARRHILAIFLGALLGTLRLGAAAPAYLCVYTLLLLLRVALSHPRRHRFFPKSPALFAEEPTLRIASALLFCFGTALYELFYGSLAIYVIYFCLAMITLGPLAAFLFLPFLERGEGFSLLLSPVTEKTEYGTSPLLWQASVLALTLVTARSLAGLSLFGVAADLFLSAFAVFFFSKRFGTLKSVFAGAILALPFGLAAVPALALLGGLAGPLWRFGGVYALSLSCLGASLACGYFGGISAFLALMPEIYCAALLAWPIYSKIAVSYAPTAQLSLPCGAPLPKELAALPAAKGSPRLLEMSRAFKSLSALFSDLSRKRQGPSYEEYYDAAAAACRGHCTACRGQNACWGKDGVAERAVKALTERALCGAEIAADILPSALLCNCQTVDKLLETARHAFAETSRAHHSQNRTENLAIDYALVAHLFEEAAREEREAAGEDVKATVALSAAFRELGIETERVAVYGNRRRRVVAGGKGWQGKQIAADTLRTTAERVCGTALSDPEFFLGKGEVRMQMESRPRFGAEVATASRPSGSGEVSGDTLDAFKNNSDFFYAYISDGMGSGREAALTSGLCGEFLKRMLEVGCSKTVTLRLLNQMIRSKGGETFATVDLLEVDLLTGAASFVKSGAVNSFVKRGENLFRIRAGTSPIGILPNLDAERIHFEVRVGDIIIMMSDGVTPTPDVPAWLLSALNGDLSGDLSLSAERLVELAQRENSAADDTSICLIKITPPKKTLA